MRRSVLGILAPLLAMAVFAGAMIPFRPHLSEAMTALVLVVPIIIGVVVGGLWAGVVSVFTGFFVYVYFFVPPYLTTSIGSTENWVALAVYMAITLPVAYVVDRMHVARAAERRRNAEIRQLLELSELIVEDRPLDVLLSTVVAAMFATFDAARWRSSFLSPAAWTSSQRPAIPSPEPSSGNSRRPGRRPPVRARPHARRTTCWCSP